MEKKLRMTADAGVRAGEAVGALRAQPVRRCRVLARGRLPLRPRLPVPRARGGDRRGRDHDQHSRHRRLRGARTVRRVHPQPARTHPELGQGGVVGALPQRPGHGRGELAGRRDDRRCAPGGVHHQRPGRTCRQLLAGRSGDGGEDAPRPLRARPRHRRHADRAGVSRWSPRPPASSCSRTRRWSARTPSRMRRASTRTACSRHATPTRSCAPRTSAGRRTRSCSASCRAAMRSSSDCRNWASRSNPKPKSTPRSRSSRTWPIARATSSTRTSSR